MSKTSVRVIRPKLTPPYAALRRLLASRLSDGMAAARADYERDPSETHEFRDLRVAWEFLDDDLPKAQFDFDDSEPTTEIEVSVAETLGGVCPDCNRCDAVVNFGRSHWAVCHVHRLRWYIGSTLNEDWRDETPNDWKANWTRVGQYRAVSPVQVEPPEDSSGE